MKIRAFIAMLIGTALLAISWPQLTLAGGDQVNRPPYGAPDMPKPTPPRPNPQAPGK